MEETTESAGKNVVNELCDAIRYLGDVSYAVLPRDIAHNLGVIRENMGQLSDAVRWYQEALALNPFLELTREGLTRLGVPVPPQPS